MINAPSTHRRQHLDAGWLILDTLPAAFFGMTTIDFVRSRPTDWTVARLERPLDGAVINRQSILTIRSENTQNKLSGYPAENSIIRFALMEGNMSNEAKPIGIDEAHIRRFTLRAAWLRRAAYSILFVIFLLILAGALVYQQAGNIAARDLGGAVVAPTHSTLEELNTTRESLEREVVLLRETRYAYEKQSEFGQRSLLELLDIGLQLSGLEAKHALLLVKIKEFNKTGEPVNANTISTLEELKVAHGSAKDYFDFVQTTLEDLDAQYELGVRTLAEVTQAEQRLVGARGHLKLLRLKIQRFAANQGPVVESGSQELPTIIQTNITRFGTLIVIFFFISILVPIYRYNIQSAAFYDAISDALMLIRDTGNGDISSLVGVLTPSVNFSKSPETPIQQSVELVKALARSRPA